MTTWQKIFATVVSATTLAVAIYEGTAAVKLRAETRIGQQNLDRLAAELSQERLENGHARRQVGQIDPGSSQPPPRFAPGSDAALEVEITVWLGRASALHRALAARPEQGIPELQLLSEEDWLRAARGFSSWTTETSADGVRTTADFLPNVATLREMARRNFMSKLATAVREYRVKNRGDLPASFDHLVPLLPASIEPAIVARYDFRCENGRVMVTEKVSRAVDPESLAFFEYDSTHPLQYNYADFESPSGRTVREACLRYAAANHGAHATEPAQLAPFLQQPVDPAKLGELFERRPFNYRNLPATAP